MRTTTAIDDLIGARDRLLALPPDGAGDGRAEYDLGDWLMLLACDLGRVADEIRRYRWGDANRSGMRAAAVGLGGHVLGFVEQLDREQAAAG